MVVGRDSPFYGRKAVSFTELKDVEMMCESSGDLRDKLNACCETAGFAPNVVMESTIGRRDGLLGGLRRAVSFVPAHRFMQMIEAHEKMARERPEQDMVERAPDLCAVRLWMRPSASGPRVLPAVRKRSWSHRQSCFTA